MELYKRNVEADIRESFSVSRAVAVLGPRQVGKSTLAHELHASGMLSSYYTLDLEDTRRAALNDPLDFIEGAIRPAAIDEIQRAPELMLAIKHVVDRDHQTPGQFLLTGSANLLANRYVADALPGRVEYVNLWPLSQGELIGTKESFIDDLFSAEVPNLASVTSGRSAYATSVVEGGFPAVLGGLSTRQRQKFFNSYVRSIFERDVQHVADLRSDSAGLERLLRLLAARTSGQANMSKLSSALQIDHKTAKAHIEILRQLFLVQQLNPWSMNLGSRHVRSPKYYVVDTGLTSSLIGVDEKRFSASEQGELAGGLLETFVIMELIKQCTWAQTSTQMFFYRDQQGREVDAVLESSQGDVVGIEVKAARTVRPQDTRGLRYLRDKLGNRFKAGVVLYCGEHTVRHDDRIWAVPVSGLWAK